jgi:hypothetical protein
MADELARFKQVGEEIKSARAAAAAVVPFIHHASTPPGGLSRTELQLLVVLGTSTSTAMEERRSRHHAGAMAMQSSWSLVVVTQPRAPPQHRHRSEPLLSPSITSYWLTNRASSSAWYSSRRHALWRRHKQDCRCTRQLFLCIVIASDQAAFEPVAEACFQMPTLALTHTVTPHYLNDRILPFCGDAAVDNVR